MGSARSNVAAAMFASAARQQRPDAFEGQWRRTLGGFFIS